MSIDQKVKEILEQIIQKKITDLDENLIAAGLIDSISSVDVALMIEMEFGANVPATDIANVIKSVNSIVNFLEKNAN